ncbi:MAG: NAD(P)-dependent alcohol dehydrogenase [Anaerolineae bacterium]|nr:NAD(P)-dependent alcohol dehydrogenase [Anaerolineae bacterium]
MQAVVYTQYGPPEVLKLQTVPIPTPKDDEVLIKVHAATVTAGDVNLRGFTFVPDDMKLLPRLAFGLRRPRQPILGTEVAGEVVAVGQAVQRFAVGDAVFGIGSSRLGAYAEYVTRKATGALATIPAGLSYTEAAAVPFGASTALYFLQQRANVQPGQQVLVNGASGGVGSYAVQIAKALGAEVTAVCSTHNLDLVRGLGADHVIDYTHEDFTQRTATYDIILDTVMGALRFADCKNALRPGGRYLAVAGGLREMLQSVWNKQVVTGTPREDAAGMAALQAMLQTGQIKPLIDRCYPLAETAEAHRYVETRRKRGSVVINVT